MAHGRVENHEQLQVWQDALELVVHVYRETLVLPAEERFGLISQMRRSATSVPANIAEGAARGSRADFARFVSIARGSLAELDTYMHLVRRLGYIVDVSKMQTRVKSLARMLTQLHRSLAS
jgi:four helix bundle protein